MPRPADIPAERWNLAVDDAGKFIDTWAELAGSLGWTTEDVFGVSSAAPLRRHDLAGLVWLLKGRMVITITAEIATIKCTDGALQTFNRHARSAETKTLWSLS